MLVLSRRLEEKVLLPTVPAIIKVISAQAGLVRLGIEAPSSVPILREELTRSDRSKLPVVHIDPAADAGPVDVVRTRIGNLLLGLTLLRVQLPDCDPSVKRTLDGIEEELHALRAAALAADPAAADLVTI